MSVTGFPLIIMSAHAQCSTCTCSIEGIPSLLCLHMLRHCGKDEGFLVKMKKNKKSFIFAKNPSSLPQNPLCSPQSDWHDWTEIQTQTELLFLHRFKRKQSIRRSGVLGEPVCLSSTTCRRFTTIVDPCIPITALRHMYIYIYVGLGIL